jgi:NAD(P)-dependent dehydrogenase (short-subunit alcohol dehydrogenase family)
MSTRYRLAGKTAIVTGATAGIGAATSRLFAAEGARLVLVGRRLEAGRRLVGELGQDRAIFLQGDVTEEDTASQAVELAHRFGSVDILVNNAAVDYTSNLLDTDLADVRRVFDTNFMGAFLMFRAAAQSMRTSGGSIVNVTSRTASVGIPAMAVYSASKGALLSLTRAAAIELAPHKIRVNAVAPGLTKTPLWDAWRGQQRDPITFQQHIEGTIPQGRLAEASEVALAILFLASDESSHITGASLAVDGGYTAV